MFKSLLLTVLISTAATAANAFPKIGDRAKFLMTDGVIFQMTVTGWDPSISAWDVVFDDPTGSYTRYWPDDDMMTSTEIAQMLSNCVTMGYVREAVTVLAGTFEACKYSHDGSTIWYADVPFGVVKSQTGNDGFELIEYEFGQ